MLGWVACNDSQGKTHHVNMNQVRRMHRLEKGGTRLIFDEQQRLEVVEEPEVLLAQLSRSGG
jgi:hypothetical protein